MKKLHIIMPMAGEGTRFKDAGYDVPKPLIKLNGIELYRHALNSLFKLDDLPFDYQDFYNVGINYTFIVRKEFIDNYHIDDEIHTYYPDANIVSIEKTTRGALETVMLAEPFIDKDNDAIVTMDCDFGFYCPSYLNAIKAELHHAKAFPLLMSFYAKNPSYSYVKTNPKNDKLGVEVAEKKVISTHAIAGCYFVGDADVFFKSAKKMIKDWESGKIESKELYMSLVYNYIVKQTGQEIKVTDMNFHKDKLWSYNTPDDFENYNEDKNIWDK